MGEKPVRTKGSNMAKIELDVLFTELNGRCGDMVYYKVWGNVYARKYVIPHNPKTEAQQCHRSLFAEGMAQWKLLGEDEKQQYRRKARKLPMHAHNLFVKQYINNNKQKAVPQPAVSSKPVLLLNNTINSRQSGTCSQAALYGLRTSSYSSYIQSLYPLYTPPE